MTDAKICALISWYDEAPSWLAACVASLAGVADHIVAVDGAYQLYPNAHAASPIEQQLALVETAAAARIPLTLHIPGEPWEGNEVEKRNATVQIALAAVAHDPSWWLCVVDADMRVTLNTGGLKQRLARTRNDVAEWGLRERLDVEANPRLARAARLGTLQKETLMCIRGIYRADPSLRYEGAHYVVRNDNGYLFGAPENVERLPATDVSMELEFDHLTQLRDLERREQSHTYYRNRDELGVEQLPSAALAEVSCR